MAGELVVVPSDKKGTAWFAEALPDRARQLEAKTGRGIDLAPGPVAAADAVQAVVLATLENFVLPPMEDES